MTMRIFVVFVTIAVALSFGMSSDPDVSSEGASTVKTTASVLIIRGPSAHSFSSNHMPRLRMIFIIRRHLARSNSSHPNIGALKSSSRAKRHSLWNGQNVLSPVSHFSEHLHGRHQHSHIQTKPSLDVKPDPELRYGRSGRQFGDDSDLTRYAASFKNRPRENNSIAKVHQDEKPNIFRRGTMFIAVFVIASLCGLGLVILLMRPRNSIADEVSEADDKTYAPLLPPTVVTDA